MVVIDKEKCKGCGLCVAFCPRKILVLSENDTNSQGYLYSICISQEECISCGFCADMCPDVCIEVYR